MGANSYKNNDKLFYGPLGFIAHLPYMSLYSLFSILRTVGDSEFSRKIV